MNAPPRPTVSVCIPCYNAERFVAQALESVLSQTYPNIEIVVTDDGSTDRSAEIVSRYKAHGVRLLRQSNKGQCAAANRAFEVCNGDLIKFFDADDVLAADHVALQVERLSSRTDAVAMGEWARFYGDDPSEAVFFPLPAYRNSAPADWLVQEWINARPMMQCGLWLIPRRILEGSGLWDERLSLINDFEFFTRVLCHAEEVLFTAGARLHYRSGVPNSLSGSASRGAVESAFLSLMLGTRRLLAAADSPRARRACANLLQDFDYGYYPSHPDLRAKARTRIAELGGSDLEPDGPPGFHKLRRMIGWRAARRAQHLAEKLKLNSAARRRWRAHAKQVTGET